MLKKRETGFEEGGESIHQSWWWTWTPSRSNIDISRHIIFRGNILHRCQLPLYLCGLRIRTLAFVFLPNVYFDYCKYIRLTTTKKKKKMLQFWRRTGLKLFKQLHTKHLLYIIGIWEHPYSNNYWKHQLLSWIRRHFIVAAGSISDCWV